MYCVSSPFLFYFLVVLHCMVAPHFVSLRQSVDVSVASSFWLLRWMPPGTSTCGPLVDIRLRFSWGASQVWSYFQVVVCSTCKPSHCFPKWLCHFPSPQVIMGSFLLPHVTGQAASNHRAATSFFSQGPESVPATRSRAE